MSLSSLYTGISGLTSFSRSISVIGNNLANMNTNGFKAGRVGFSDILSQSLTGSTGEYQIGRGVELATVNAQFAQGSFETSSSPTDLAIDGDGFFIVRDPNGIYYTRSGMYIFDTNGDLVNPNGYALQGWHLDANGEISGALGNINIGAISSAPNPTDNAYFKLNLDSTAETPALNWDDQDPHRTSNYSSSMTVYDSLGREHLVTAFFRKAGSNSWTYYILANANEVGEVHSSSEQTNTRSEDFITAATNWADLTRSGVSNNATIDFAGTDVNGNAVASTFTIANASTGTIQDILTEIENQYGLTAGNATITADGRIQAIDQTGLGNLDIQLDEQNEGNGTLDFGGFAENPLNTFTSDQWMTVTMLNTGPISSSTE